MTDNNSSAAPKAARAERRAGITGRTEQRAENCFFADSLLFRLVVKMQASLVPDLAALGAFAAGRDAREKARAIHIFPPRFAPQSGQGAGAPWRDTVLGSEAGLAAHPAYHGLLTRARHAGLAFSLYDADFDPAPLRHRARACRLFLMAQADCAPLQDMAQTSAAFAALEREEALSAVLKPFLQSRIHDPSRRFFKEKQSISLSFACAGEGCAAPLKARHFSGDDAERAAAAAAFFGSSGAAKSLPLYRLSGSLPAVLNPLSDGFIAAALADGIPQLFFVPAFKGAEQENGIELLPAPQDFAAAAGAACLSGLRFDNSVALRIGGDLGADAQMAAKAGAAALNRARRALLADYAALAAGLLRGALRDCLLPLRHKSGIFAEAGAERFTLSERVLADAALDAAAAEILMLRLAQARDSAAEDAQESAFAALLLPALVFWLHRLVPKFQEFQEHLCGRAVLGQALSAWNNRLLCPSFWTEHDYGRGGGIFALLTQLRAALRLGDGGIIIPKEEILDNLPQAMAAGAKNVLQLAAQRASADAGAAFFFADRLVYSFAAAALYGADCGNVAAAFAESRLGGIRQSDYGSLSPRHNAEFILEALYPPL